MRAAFLVLVSVIMLFEGERTPQEKLQSLVDTQAVAANRRNDIYMPLMDVTDGNQDRAATHPGETEGSGRCRTMCHKKSP